MPTLSQMFIYPVKSLAGIQVTDWPVRKNGLLYDRKWMLIDAQQQFLSQRRLPKMALIRPSIEHNQLVLKAPGLEDLRLPLEPSSGEQVQVRIWHDQCLARTVSSLADAWFSRFLQMDCHLVYHPDDQIRLVDQEYANAGDQTAFSDGFPFLIIAESSLNCLNSAMESPIGMQRFRPNLVVAECAAYAEDTWRHIRINDIGFTLPKPCSRCSVPGIDPETALTSKEPLTTLSRLRKWQNKIYFGQNAIHQSQGSLRIGSPVDIIETGDTQPPLS